MKIAELILMKVSIEKRGGARRGGEREVAAAAEGMRSGAERGERERGMGRGEGVRRRLTG